MPHAGGSPDSNVSCNGASPMPPAGHVNEPAATPSVRLNPLFKQRATPSTGASDASCTAPTPGAYTPALTGRAWAGQDPVIHGQPASNTPEEGRSAAEHADANEGTAGAAREDTGKQGGAGEEGTPSDAGFAPGEGFSPELPIRQQLTALTLSRGPVPSARKAAFSPQAPGPWAFTSPMCQAAPPALSIPDSVAGLEDTEDQDEAMGVQAQEAATADVAASGGEQEAPASSAEQHALAIALAAEAAEEEGGDAGGDENTPEPAQRARLQGRCTLPPKTPQSAVRRMRAVTQHDESADAPTPMRNPLRVATPARCWIRLVVAACITPMQSTSCAL